MEVRDNEAVFARYILVDKGLDPKDICSLTVVHVADRYVTETVRHALCTNSPVSCAWYRKMLLCL
jgi:hypothetical protein